MLEAFGKHEPEIHETAFVHEMATVIGEVVIGAESSVWPGAVLRGDDGPIVIGDKTSIQDGTVIHNTEGWSTTSVGNGVTVGHNVTLHGCKVEDDCLIGMGAIILDNAVIGKGSVVGAGSLIPVGKVIPPGSVVMGNPYKIVRQAGEKEQFMIKTGMQAYNYRTKQYLRSRKEQQ